MAKKYIKRASSVKKIKCQQSIFDAVKFSRSKNKKHHREGDVPLMEIQPHMKTLCTEKITADNNSKHCASSCDSSWVKIFPGKKDNVTGNHLNFVVIKQI